MDQTITKLQEYLDLTARNCLRVLETEKLTESQSKRLEKFMFGCMNQKHELPRRVKERGSGEFGKVLRFISRACEVLLEIEQGANEGSIDNGH